MAEQQNKIFVGSGKEVFENLINISVCLSDLPKEYIREYNGKKYISLEVNTKREADKFGKTHSLTVNTWKPDGNSATSTAKSTPVADNTAVVESVMNDGKIGSTDDLPF